MPPKKATSTTKKAGTPAAHPPYADMIKEAVITLKEKGGSSRQSIKKFVQANFNLAGVTEAAFNTNINKALQKGSESGTFLRPKGPSGPVKLGAPSKAAATKKTTAKPKTAAVKKTAAKPKTAKSASATKKAPVTKKTTTTKSKANTSKVRKTPAMAPAVEDKKPVAIAKTKSGRVQKTTAPQPDKKAGVKKTATKKSAPKKAATTAAAKKA